MVVWEVVKCVVVFVVVVVVVLFGNFDFSDTHDIYSLLGKMCNYSLRFC